MNNGNVFDDMLKALKLLFPFYEDTVLLSVLTEKDYSLESAIEYLLMLSADNENKGEPVVIPTTEIKAETQPEKELSLFENQVDNDPNNYIPDEVDFNQVELIECLKKFCLANNIDPNDDYLISFYINNPEYLFKDQDLAIFEQGDDPKNKSPSQEKGNIENGKKPKKSFGKRFKEWLKNVFKKEKKEKKGDYEVVFNQDESELKLKQLKK